MKLKIHPYFAAFLLSGLALASCKENDIVYDTDVEGKEFRTVALDVPLGKVKIPVYATLQKELKTEDSIRLNDKGVMYVEYTHEEQVEWTDNIGIKEVANHFDYDVADLGSLPTPPPGLPPLPTYPYTYNGERDTAIVLTTATAAGDEDASTWVEKVTFAEGEFSFTIVLPSGFVGSFLLEIPQLTLAGESASFSRSINTETAAVPDDYHIDLTGATIETAAVGGFQHGMLIKYSFQIGGNIGLSTETKVSVGYGMSGVKVSKMFGYFGQQAPKDDEEGEIDLDFFDDFNLSGQFDFINIEIDAEVKNKLGIPLSIQGDFAMYQDENKIDNALTLTPTFDLKVESATYDTGNETVVTETSLFQTKAALLLDGNNLPNKMKFKVSGIANPTPASDGWDNFLVKGGDDENLVDVALNIRIPFHFKTSQYTREDTIKFDFNDLIKDSENESEAMDSVILRLTIDNGLPLDINLGMVALAADGQRLNTPVISAQLIKAGVPTGNGNQITPEHSVLMIRLTQTQIKEFRDRDVKNLIMETGAKTGGSEYVTLNDQSFLNIEVSLHATVSLSSNLF
ncbi:MAG: hypothetical protein LBS03_09580 [Bacteroidales bacterium]|jgi:hypothetical protein|nr:hypothetical protein [Bacteroidales bacterium]